MTHILKCVFLPILVFACFLAVSAHSSIDDITSLRKETERGNSITGRGVRACHNEEINGSRKTLAQEPEPPTSIDAGYINGYEVVDLGLSVKWAACNVGAASSSFYNRFDYFAWGENRTKYEYKKSNSRTYGVKITNSIEGIASYDAARANWGGSWRLPTKKEMEELINKCKWEWERRYFIGGYFVDGYNVTGPNGNSIFLPAAGRLYGRTVYDWGLRGGYITSTPAVDAEFSYVLSFTKDKYECTGSLRAAGWAVRPVTD